MRYTSGQSANTRRRIVKIAAAEMRKHGPNNVGVANVMRRAGLTHGGFYAHFASKDDLTAAAVKQMFAEARALRHQMTEGKTKEESLRAFINGYVSASHRDNPQLGCAIAALSSDIYRQKHKTRAAYDEGFTSAVNAVTHLLSGDNETEKRALAISMVAEMTGAVAAARAVSDITLSGEILASARRALRARAGLV